MPVALRYLARVWLLVLVFPTLDVRAAAEDVMTLQVDVFLLEFWGYPHLSAEYGERELEELFAEVNAIWAQAGIQWNLASVERVDLREADFEIPTRGFMRPREFRNAVATVIPEDPSAGRWPVYFVRQFPVPGSGVYLVELGTVLYGELNQHGVRRPVVLAHELGHSLGLPHVPQPDNLMYGGRDRNPELTQNLNPRQINRARAQAKIGPWQRARSSRQVD